MNSKINIRNSLYFVVLISIYFIYKYFCIYTTQDLFELALRYDKNVNTSDIALIEIRNIERQIYSKGTEPIEYIVSLLNTSEITIRKNLFERVKYTYNQLYSFIYDIIFKTHTKMEPEVSKYFSYQCQTNVLGQHLIAYEILDHIETEAVVNYIRDKMEKHYGENSQIYLIKLLAKSNNIIDMDKLVSYIRINISDNVSECAHLLLKNKLLSLGINDIPGNEIYKILICHDRSHQFLINTTCQLPHRIPRDSFEVAILKTNEWWSINRSTIENLLNIKRKNRTHN